MRNRGPGRCMSRSAAGSPSRTPRWPIDSATATTSKSRRRAVRGRTNGSDCAWEVASNDVRSERPGQCAAFRVACAMDSCRLRRHPLRTRTRRWRSVAGSWFVDNGTHLARRSSSPSSRSALIPDRIGPTECKGGRACQPRSLRHPRESRSQRWSSPPVSSPRATDQIAFVHVAGAQQRLRYLATAKDLVRPRRGDPRNGDCRPAAETAVGGARGCASRRAAAVRFRQTREKRSAATRRNSRA